ncbi:UPF0223 family protein [Fructilactobacillus ixorae]|uniref:UPF0223 family protein n=1 Tax=Fructilactobacillus ixorae TaxID=1750535 RepID=A0ABY5C364_9LACO|nr:UPF0223 family protein [Fructilactobacillus ixorae]USS92876.1 UPF0223 family protein [Fructilactobacillus ixorae]
MKQKAKSTYSYPIVADWSVAELVAVTEFFQNIERAYEQPQGVLRADLMASYADFQTINPARTEQNQLRREFERSSGFDIYAVLQAAAAQPTAKLIKLN